MKDTDNLSVHCSSTSDSYRYQEMFNAVVNDLKLKELIFKKILIVQRNTSG